jgi:hypothetical protein
MACDWPFFERPSTVLVGAHDGGVDHGVFVIGVFGQMLEDRLQDSASSPTAEPRMHHPEIAETLRQIPPWNLRSIAIKDCHYNQTVVRRRPTHNALTPW